MTIVQALGTGRTRMSKERKDEKETSFYSTQLANERQHLPITPEAVGIGEMALTSKYAGGRRWRRTTSEGEGRPTRARHCEGKVIQRWLMKTLVFS